MAKRSRQWRSYETSAGNCPFKKFFDDLPDEDAASVAAAMKEVRHDGLEAARHIDGDIWEVRADGDRVIYRVLFAPQGRYSQVFLALHAFKKKTQKTPPREIDLAKRRLRDWIRQGQNAKRKRQARKGRAAG